jgi:hypothetical protein
MHSFYKIEILCKVNGYLLKLKSIRVVHHLPEAKHLSMTFEKRFEFEH